MATKTLQNAREALEGLNADKLVECYADNFLFEDPSSNERFTDRASLIQYFQQLFGLPKVSFSDFKILEAEHFATIEWTWSGMSPITGKPYRVRGASVIELTGGKVSRESLYYNPKPYWSSE